MDGRLHHVRVTGLTPDQARSLAATLAAAAIASEGDPAHGTVLVPRSRNRMFRPAQIETVVHEWLAETDSLDAPHQEAGGSSPPGSILASGRPGA